MAGVLRCSWIGLLGVLRVFWETHDHAGLGPSAPEQQRTIWRGAEGARRSPRWHPRPPSAQRRVLSDPAFALWIPAWLSRCSLVWLGAASRATHPALGRLHTLAAALRTAAARAPRPPAASPAPPGRAALSSAGPSRSAALPAASPSSRPSGSCQARGSRTSPRAPASPLLPLCARERSWGGGRRGRSLCLSVSRRLRPGRSKCRWEGGRPGEGAGSRRAARAPRRAWERSPQGGSAGASIAALRPPLAPPPLAPTPDARREAERSVRRRPGGRKPHINSGGGSASSGGAGSAGRVQRLVPAARPRDLAMGWGPRRLRRLRG